MQLFNVEYKLKTTKVEAKKTFVQDQELAEKLEHLEKLSALLSIDKKGDMC